MTTLTVVRHARQDYLEALAEQRALAAALLAGADGDTLILTEHPPVYTVTRTTRPEELLTPNAIPRVWTDRGGKVTYHAPGQLIAYVIRDLRPRLGVREHVWRLEQAVIDTLRPLGIEAQRQAGLPGVWVAGAKIAALGVRVSRGIASHGLALNRDLELAPYQAILPCGLSRPVTSLALLGVTMPRAELEERFLTAALPLFGQENLQPVAGRGTVPTGPTAPSTHGP